MPKKNDKPQPENNAQSQSSIELNPNTPSPSSKIALARAAFQKLKAKEQATNEFDRYVAAMLKEKMEAGLTREQAMSVIHQQIAHDARIGVL